MENSIPATDQPAPKPDRPKTLKRLCREDPQYQAILEELKEIERQDRADVRNREKIYRKLATQKMSFASKAQKFRRRMERNAKKNVRRYIDRLIAKMEVKKIDLKKYEERIAQTEARGRTPILKIQDRLDKRREQIKDEAVRKLRKIVFSQTEIRSKLKMDYHGV